MINDCLESGFINIGGIESPGLTAAPAIAQYVTEELIAKHIKLIANNTYNPYRRKVTRLNEISKAKRNEMVKTNPLYGKIICRCEEITEGEIVDSIHRNCGARSIVGVKNRVRAGAGRCQGGFCQSEVLKILAREQKIDKMNVEYSKQGSNILKFRTKGE